MTQAQYQEVQAFFTKWLNRGIDFDGAYGFQCMDLYQLYNRDIVGAPHVPNPAAADVWTNFPTAHYEKIANSPTNAPQIGDVIIWKKTSSLPYGHIAVCCIADANEIKSWDQNWPTGSLTHLQIHNYTGVQGWLRPKKFIETAPAPKPVPEPQKPIYNILLTPDTVVSQDNAKIDLGAALGGISELQAIKSRLADLERDNKELRRNAVDLTKLSDELAKIQIAYAQLVTEHTALLNNPAQLTPSQERIVKVLTALGLW